MIQRRVFIIFACSFASVLFGFGQGIAQAQTLGISPVYIDAKVKRGATYDNAFTIANNTGTRLRFHFSVSDYWYDENNVRVEGRPGSLPRSASLWVQFSPTELVIEPGNSGTVKAIISVPRTAAGGYYTSPIFEAEAADKPAAADQKAGTMSASIVIRVSGLIMLTTDDNAEYFVEVLGGQITPPTQLSELQIHLDMRNRSTAHAHLRGVLAIFDSSGKLAGRGKIEQKRYMPGQRDMLNAPWAGELAPGHYTAVITLSYDRAGMEPATLVYEISFDVK